MNTTYKCTDCGAVFDRPGPCPKCPHGYRRLDAPQLHPLWDITAVPDTVPPRDDFNGPDDIVGPHGPGCTCGL